ncbi:MAG: YeeE/YedE family protein [Rhodobacterales bacterium]|nr:YeeE/YedE family protein [Rhodobacterales bacterium]
MRLFLAYVIGLVFGLGISISGMANPAKVLNFFDFAGSWDPSLAFVMGGAFVVAFIGYRLVFRRPAPLLAPRFAVPGNTRLDAKLLGGAAVFGIGWGISGFCPGGSLPALGTGNTEVYIFTGALLAGIIAAKLLMQFTIKWSSARAAA